MALSELKLTLSVDGQGNVTGALNDITASSQRLNAEAGKTGENFRQNMGKATSCLEQMRDQFDKLTSYAMRFSAVMAGGGLLGGMIKSVVNAGIALEKYNAILKASTGSADLAASELSFIREQANRLGLEMNSTTESYARFLGAAKNTSIEGAKAREVFIGISEGLAAMKLPAEQSHRAFVQIQQMMSKGKLMSEDMVVLSESLPGAFQMVADAMGLPAVKLRDMMEKGQVLSADVLPKLAQQMHNTFGKQAVEAADSAQGAINRFNNELQKTKEQFAVSILPAFTSGLKTLTANIDNLVSVGTAGIAVLTGTIIGRLVPTIASVVVAHTAERAALLAKAAAFEAEAAAATRAATIKQMQTSTSAMLAAKALEMEAAAATRAAAASAGLNPTLNATASALQQKSSAATAAAAAAATLNPTLNANTVALSQKAAAARVEAAAMSASATASRGAAAALAFLGGPLGVVIALLGTAAAAWNYYMREKNRALDQKIAETENDPANKLAKEIGLLKEQIAMRQKSKAQLVQEQEEAGRSTYTAKIKELDEKIRTYDAETDWKGPSLEQMKVSRQFTVEKLRQYESLTKAHKQYQAVIDADNKKRADADKAALAKKATGGQKETDFNRTKAIGDANRAWQEAYWAWEDAGHKANAKSAVESIQWQYEQGLKTTREYLDKKEQLEKGVIEREIERNNNRVKAMQESLSITMGPGNDPNSDQALKHAQAQEQLIKALTKGIELTAQLNAVSNKANIDREKGALEHQKQLLTAEAALLSSQGSIIAATLKQIEVDKLGRRGMDDKTKAVYAQLDALKLLKAKQDEANALSAVTNKTEDINISMISDPYERQRQQIEANYQREKELIEQKIELLNASKGQELSAIDAITKAGIESAHAVNKVKYFDNPAMLEQANQARLDADKAYIEAMMPLRTAAQEQTNRMLLALADQLNTLTLKKDKDLAENKLAQEKAAWEGVIDVAQKAFPKLAGLDKALNAVFKDHAVMRRNVSGELVKDETASNLSMYSAYGAAAAGIFEGMAAAQDTTTRQGFEAAKDYNLAAAFMSTASGMMAQLAGPDGWSPSAWGRAAVVGLMGAIQIAQIASTTFGGGGSVASAPSGTFASTGGSSGSSSGLGNLALPLTSIQDNRTAETYERMIASSDSVVEAIGKLSKSIDDLTDLFSEGGAGYILATNAPNRGMTVDLTKQSSPFGFGALKKEIGNSLGVNGVGNFVLNGLSGGIAGLITSIFSSENRITEAGISLGVTAGEIMAQQFSKREVGNWWSGSKTRLEYKPDQPLNDYVRNMLQPFVNDITNMAKTLGTTVDLTKTTVEMTNIATAGGKPEEIAKKIEEWSLKALQGFALGVEGLTGPGGYIADYDDAYIALKRLNDAVVTLKDSFLLIGKTVVEGSMANAQAADSLITLMGGVDDFNESINTYFTSMFTDAEQEASKFAEAQRSVNSMFLELNRAVPSTREEFRNLVNALDITDKTSAETFDALMTVSEAFGTLMTSADEAAQKLKEVQQATEDLDVRYLKATGKSTDADTLSRQLSAQREIEQAITDNMGDAYINRLRDVLAAENILSAAEPLKNAFAEEKKQLTEAYNAELALLQDRLNGAKTVVSDLTNSVRKLTAASDRMKLQNAAFERSEYQAAQAQIAAILVQARGGDLSGLKDIDKTLDTLTSITADSYASSDDYQRDFWQAKNSMRELEKMAAYQLTDAEKTLQAQQTQIELLKTNHESHLAALDAQLSTLMGINNSVQSLADAIAQFLSATQLPKGPGNSIENLYQNILGRSSDATGKAYWEAKAATGTSLTQIADQFRQSPEYQVQQLYQSVLGRSGETAGVQYWEQQIAAGMTLGEVAQRFKDSQEYKKLNNYAVGTSYVPYDMTANIHQGEMVIDRASSDVLRKYGIPAYGQADNSGLSDEVHELRKENRELNSKLERLLSRIADSSDRTARATNGNPDAPVIVEVVNG